MAFNPKQELPLIQFDFFSYLNGLKQTQMDSNMMNTLTKNDSFFFSLLPVIRFVLFKKNKTLISSIEERIKNT